MLSNQIEAQEESASRSKSFKQFIYGLKCPISNQFRYVGLTVNCKKRYFQHSTGNSDLSRFDWIYQLSEKGLSPEFIILDTANNQFDGLILETHTMCALRNNGHILLNDMKYRDNKALSILNSIGIKSRRQLFEHLYSTDDEMRALCLRIDNYLKLPQFTSFTAFDGQYLSQNNIVKTLLSFVNSDYFSIVAQNM